MHALVAGAIDRAIFLAERKRESPRRLHGRIAIAYNGLGRVRRADQISLDGGRGVIFSHVGSAVSDSPRAAVPLQAVIAQLLLEHRDPAR